MTEPQWLDVKDLRTKLENYKLIVSVNEELVNSNVSTRDELASQLVAVQVFIDQLDCPGDSATHYFAMNKAKQLISEIDRMIRAILSQDTEQR